MDSEMPRLHVLTLNHVALSDTRPRGSTDFAGTQN